MSRMSFCTHTHRLTTGARRRRCAQRLFEGSRPSMPGNRRRGHIRLFRRGRSRILLLSRNRFSRRRRRRRYRSSSLDCRWRCGRPRRRRRNSLQRTRPDQALTTASKRSRASTITITTTTARRGSRRPLRPRPFLILLLLRRSPSMCTSRGSTDSIALTPPLR